MDVEGFYELNIFDNNMDESDVYASNDESSSKVSYEKCLYMRFTHTTTY